MIEMDELLSDARRRGDLGGLRRLLAVAARLQRTSSRSLHPETLAAAERQVSIMLYREDRLLTPGERAEMVALAYEHLIAAPGGGVGAGPGAALRAGVQPRSASPGPIGSGAH
jgi:hypothetical protein